MFPSNPTSPTLSTVEAILASKEWKTVELVIVTTPDIVDGKLLPASERGEKPPVVPAG